MSKVFSKTRQLEEIDSATSWHAGIVGVLCLAKIYAWGNTDSRFIHVKYMHKSDWFVVRWSMCVSTVIDGLDILIESGFFRGSVILVAGETGSGKTILSTHFIRNFAIYGNADDGRRKVLVKNP